VMAVVVTYWLAMIPFSVAAFHCGLFYWETDSFHGYNHYFAQGKFGYWGYASRLNGACLGTCYACCGW
jgi:hypothetical protein